MILIRLVLAGTILSLLACDQARQPDSAQATESVDESEPFEEFYQRFHEDSLFQMSRITFPLEGLPAAADSSVRASGTFRWQANEWVLHRPFDLNNPNFTHELAPLSDDLVLERFSTLEGRMSIVRRFARLSDGWHLIYYSELN